MRLVVVGPSLGGVRTVQGLRRRGFADELVLIGNEPGTADGIAADRPPLSKSFLTDPAATAPALLTTTELSELGVQLVSGRAVDLDLDSRRVTVHGGGRLAFDGLVVATGSTPRLLPGLETMPGVHVLRSAADAAGLRASCGAGTRLVVIGGGFIGAEVAWAAFQLGAQVTIVETLPALMMRGLGPDVGAVFTGMHRRAGIDVRLGVGVAGLEGVDKVETVRLTDGTGIDADLVVLGLGTVPETGWLTSSGLDLQDGVVCDERLAAVGADNVYAVGDLARWRHPRYDNDVRVEHWTNAVETAAVVAANLTGTWTAHDALPYVWSDQLGARLQVFGRIRPQDEVRYVHGDSTTQRFVAVSGGEGRLQAVLGFGAVKQLLPYRKLLLAGASWDEIVGTAASRER